MAGYKAIKDQLVSILGGVSSIKTVSSNEPKGLNEGGYPIAAVSAKEHTSNFYSVGPSGSNERVYQHYIRVYFRTDETNNPDYEDVLETTIDDVITAIETNITLNNTVDWAIPISGVWRYGEKESPLRICELVVASTVHVAR